EFVVDVVVVDVVDVVVVLVVLDGQLPQSPGQLVQFSVGGSQVRLPHTGGHVPQSAEQFVQFSSGVSQVSSPHTHTPQSPGQVVQFSVRSQVKSPQVARPACAAGTPATRAQVSTIAAAIQFRENMDCLPPSFVGSAADPQMSMGSPSSRNRDALVGT